MVPIDQGITLSLLRQVRDYLKKALNTRAFISIGGIEIDIYASTWLFHNNGRYGILGTCYCLLRYGKDFDCDDKDFDDAPLEILDFLEDITWWLDIGDGSTHTVLPAAMEALQDLGLPTKLDLSEVQDPDTGEFNRFLPECQLGLLEKLLGPDQEVIGE